jgi:hypothetical protein
VPCLWSPGRSSTATSVRLGSATTPSRVPRTSSIVAAPLARLRTGGSWPPEQIRIWMCPAAGLKDVVEVADDLDPGARRAIACRDLQPGNGRQPGREQALLQRPGQRLGARRDRVRLLARAALGDQRRPQRIRRPGRHAQLLDRRGRARARVIGDDQLAAASITYRQKDFSTGCSRAA